LCTATSPLTLSAFILPITSVSSTSPLTLEMLSKKYETPVEPGLQN
jgi:hypothetical protein